MTIFSHNKSMFLLIFIIFSFTNIVQCDFVCKECQKLANDLLSIPESNMTYTTIENELNQICNQTLSGNPFLLHKCENIVKGFVGDLEYLGMFRKL